MPATWLGRALAAAVTLLALLILTWAVTPLLTAPPAPAGVTLPLHAPRLTGKPVAPVTAYAYAAGQLRALDAAQAAAQAQAAAKAAAAQQAALQQSVTDAVASGTSLFTAAQVGQIWLDAGGSAAAEMTAECIAEHESGNGYSDANADAISPTADVGIFQINVSHDPGMSWSAWVAYMEVPANNAHYAVMLSADGNNWGPWTTAPDCGV